MKNYDEMNYAEKMEHLSDMHQREPSPVLVDTAGWVCKCGKQNVGFSHWCGDCGRWPPKCKPNDNVHQREIPRKEIK